MPQSADLVKDHTTLFLEPEYQELFKRKAQFECGHTAEEIAKQGEYIGTWEYREKNLARKALTINPAKACQPLGGVFCAAGFEKTLAFNHGSQGCTAYFRSHFARHFKEPCAVVSTSMTEDAAVFGGMKNMVEGLGNAYKLYKPKMIAVCTTCLAEVIGDDLSAYLKNAREQGVIPMDFPVSLAHTPSFVGSHIVGYDSMLKGVLSNFWAGKTCAPGESVNIIPGFDGFCVGNNRELKRMLDAFGIEYTILSDASDVFDTPTDGTYRMYDGGTSLEAVGKAIDAKATISMQKYCTAKSMEMIAETGQETVALHYPLGVGATDEFLMKISDLSGKPVPETLEKERGRLVDAMADSASWVHGKTFSVYGDPDFVYGITRFLLEIGAEPKHLLCTNGGNEWAEDMKALLAASPAGAQAQLWPGKDLWAMRSLLATEPSDFLIGNSYGKYLERDVGIPLIRLTFPIFDRHHHHRFPVWGYAGGLQVLVTIMDRVLQALDDQTVKTGISYDLVR